MNMGRPRVLRDPEPDERVAVLREVASSVSITDACRELGCSVNLVRAWRRRDNRFDRSIVRAILAFRHRRTVAIAKLIASGRSVDRACRDVGVTRDRFYSWRRKSIATDMRIKAAIKDQREWRS